MKPCWSCGTETPDCDPVCECAKCVNPIAYDEWKNENPQEYQDWLEAQIDDDG